MESIASKNSSRNQCLSGIDWRKCEGHTEDDTFFFFFLNHQNFIKEKHQVTRHKKYQNNTATAKGKALLRNKNKLQQSAPIPNQKQKNSRPQKQKK
jgi:hypothetical protein